MWIKICATTNVEDALFAAEAGADAVGFVFAKSPRQVTPEQVRLVVDQLPASLEKIGVFMSLGPEMVAEAVRTARLTGVQLHGGHSPDLIATLRKDFGRGLRIIQTAHWAVGRQDPDALADELSQLRDEPEISAVLVDSRTVAAEGGTGVSFDWHAARNTVAVLAPKPLIVAGGLDSGNVMEAIRTLRPWGVDVASGVEREPGRKAPERVRAFIRAARAAAEA